MRTLPPALAAKWQAGVTTLARGWRLTRQDGFVVAATEHDRDLYAAGILFKASLSLSESPAEAELALNPGHAALSGALSVEGIEADAISLGLWDQARVEAYLIDWQDPELYVPFWSGFVHTIVHHGSGFELNIQTLEPAMNQTIGRVYARTCDARLGDVRCGVDLSVPAYQTLTSINAIENDRRLLLAETQSLDLEAMRGGTMRFISGKVAGLSRAIQGIELVDGEWVALLAQPLPVLPAMGDEVSLSPGCDKRFETCRTRFSNHLNFRGIPTLPGETAMITGPSAAGNTGGKR